MYGAFIVTGRFGTVLRLLFYTALILGLFLSLIGFFGSHHVAFDGTNHFRLHLTSLSAAGLCVAWFFDRWRAVAGATVCLALNLLALTWFLPDAATTPVAEQDTPLKVSTFNIWGGNEQLHHVDFFLRKEAPDIVVLQEVRPKALSALDRLKELYPYQIHCAHHLHCGLALLSKFPLADTHWSDRTETAPPMVRGRVHVPDEDGVIPVTVIGTHFAWALPNRGQFQNKESLKTTVNAVDGEVIVLGDFNATPWSFVVSDLAISTNTKLVHRFLPTWPAIGPAPQFPIDLMFVSQGVGRIDVARGAVPGSDHRPIIAELALDSRLKVAIDSLAPDDDGSTKIADRLPQ